jgi:hypothetical protein
VKIARLLTAALLIGLFQGAACADAGIAFQGRNGIPPGVVYVSQGKVRVQARNRADERGYALYDGQRRMLTVVDDHRRRYYEVSEETLGRFRVLTDRGGPLMGFLRGQLEALSPGERQRIEERLGSAGLGGLLQDRREQPPVRTVATGARRTVSGIPCAVHRIERGGVEVGEICLADPQELPIPSSDAATLMALLDFVKAAAVEAAPLAGRWGGGALARAIEGVEGVPVAGREFETGATLQVNQVSTDRLSPDLFQLPAGYRRADVPFLSSGG